jgi:hypothetical protein
VSPIGSAILACVQILGAWRFDHYIYKKQDLPARDPNMELIFEFKDSGESRLYWSSDQGHSFCERKGTWTCDREGLVVDTVTEANPRNKMDCSADPDMQPGHRAEIPYQRVDDKLYFTIPLGNEEIIYVFQSLPTK